MPLTCMHHYLVFEIYWRLTNASGHICKINFNVLIVYNLYTMEDVVATIYYLASYCRFVILNFFFNSMILHG